MKTLLAWLAGFRPAALQVGWIERLRAATGALAGIAVTALASRLVLGADAAVPLIAPMGASAVLLFAVPASPLAQPWSIVGGNGLSALVGVTAALLVPEPALAAGLGVGGAIGVMLLCRCLHPPGGAVALTAVVGGAAIHAEGYGFVLAPVLLNSGLLLLTALLFNNATRRRYPHRPPAPQAHGTADKPPTERLGFVPADLDAVLKRHGEILDIGRPDLEELFREAELEAYRRRFGVIRCAEIMSRDLVTVRPDTPLREAWALLRQHRIKALPVIEGDRRLVGILTQSDFMRHAEWDPRGGLQGDLRRFLRQTLPGQRRASVGAVMTRSVQSAGEATPITDLVPWMADGGRHHIPIVDADGRLTGIVTQSDLVAALYRGRLLDAG